MAKILVINPGSTSTKIAVYENETTLFMESIEHDQASLAPYPSIYDQYEMRAGIIRQVLAKHNFQESELAAVVGRGGLLPKARAGAYLVTEPLLHTLRYKPQLEHVSNIGAALAHSIATPLGLPSYIYDPVTVDELEPISRITGMREIERRGQGHNLNMRAAAHKKAKEVGRPYDEMTILVAHMGGGITLTLHHKGRIIDMVSDDEGPFSPERSGRIPTYLLSQFITSGSYDYSGIYKKLARQGGLMSHCGTTDAREVLKMRDAGDERAGLVLEAMCLTIAKSLAELAVVVNGQVDHIVITGGLAYSPVLTGWIIERVSFIAPVSLIPGENEMESLALGALRVLRGEEKAREYQPQ